MAILVKHFLFVVAFLWTSTDAFPPKSRQFRLQQPRRPLQLAAPLASQKSSADKLPNASPQQDTSSAPPRAASKRQMLQFALPALGIYLANPLLSNIDNAFVGRTVGTTGLAALSPATLCVDQSLYLFVFLSRATTGLVSRAYGSGTPAARQAAAAPLSVSVLTGLVLSIVLAVATPSLLQALQVQPALQASARSYILCRGAISSFALLQSICLSVLMATRDAMTPLKIVAAGSLLNVVGDAALCVWPWKLGVPGAALATAAATVVTAVTMVQTLRRKDLWPEWKWPTGSELLELLTYSGPLILVIVTRLLGLVAMQTSAMALGVQPLAAYQLCLNVLVFFLLFGEPLSQLSQTQIPALLDQDDEAAGNIRSTLKSVAVLALGTALAVGSVTYGTVFWGASCFTTDPAVIELARQTGPAVFLSVVVSIVTVAMDGAMLASRDFGFMLGMGLTSFVTQIALLKTQCQSLTFIFGTFTMRLGSYLTLGVARTLLGYGNLGRAIRPVLAARRRAAKLAKNSKQT